jgi:RNA polymerase sigma factor (TIGR02999 family)
MTDVTQILSEIEKGDPSAADQLLPLVYDELRRLAAARLKQEKPGQTLQATALVHEAYVRLVNASEAQHWNSRGHFFGAAAESMRRILVEQARRKKSLKGGGGLNRVELSDADLRDDDRELDMIALDDAIRGLESDDPRAAEVLKLRFFAGLTIKQAAEAIGISPATADNDWAYARSWLRVQLSGETEENNS